MLNEETKEFIQDLLSAGKIGSKEMAMLKDELSDNGADIMQCFDEIEKTAVDYLTEHGKDVQKFKVFWHAEKYKMQNGIADIPNGTDYDDEFEELLNAVIIDNKADVDEMAYLAKECAKRNISIDTIGTILENRIAERSPDKVKRFQLSWRVRRDELGIQNDSVQSVASSQSKTAEDVAPAQSSSANQETSSIPSKV